MEVDGGGNDSAHGNGNLTESKGMSDNNRENNNHASDSGHKKSSASGGKNCSGASKEQTVHKQVVVDIVQTALLHEAGNSNLNFNQIKNDTRKCSQKESVELIWDAVQQEFSPTILEKLVHDHVLLSQLDENKLVAEKPQGNFMPDQVDHKKMASNVHETKMQDNASHDKVSGARFRDGNSLLNTEQEHDAEDHASTSVHALLVSHAGPESRSKVDKARQV
jgi:hypothetical protein